MQSLLSRVSLKVQIGLLVVLAGLVFAGSSAIQTVSRHQVEASLEAASTQRQVLDEVDKLAVGLLEARRHEKNFLLRHDAQSQREHAQAVAAMTAALDGLTSRLPADQTEQQALAAKVREGVGRYVDGFRTMVGLQIAAGLDASDGPAGARIDEAVRRLDQPRLSVAFLSMRRAEAAALTKPGPESRAAWTELAAEFQRLADGTGLRGQLDAYRAAVTTALDQAQAARAAEKVMIQAHREILEPALNALSAKAHADMEQSQALADRIGRQARSTGLAIELGGIAVIVIVGWLLAHSIYRPVKDITGVMLQLADGQTGIAIPAQNRHDEVGDMARSVEIFRTAMAEAEHLRLEQEEERRRAARDRAAAILSMADDFEASVKTKVAAVDHATLGIRGTAQTMADRSQRSGSRSLDVGESARISNERANSVADATRQLALAINEIAQQVAHSTAIARKTVEDVDATANQMEQLAGSVQAIGDVVSMINAIASQTRMLALNATKFRSIKQVQSSPCRTPLSLAA
ncbi:Methyl-accepting chemotaxis protein (fragment) [Magnetospirillum sp. LM-5]|uniref:HAMP domain-containing protein n=1 Tax=Magnetospirillum sp. LM-5 TaxID=2681466 RepID=UPI00137C7068